jgi:hypothetical protein
VSETLSAILAYHWREAGEPSRAIPYLLDAAERARRSWARGAVIDLYTRAYELTEDDELKRKIRLERGSRSSSSTISHRRSRSSARSCRS